MEKKPKKVPECVKKLTANIQRVINDRGIKSYQFAGKVHNHAVTVSDILNNKVPNVSFEFAYNASKALEISLDDLASHKIVEPKYDPIIYRIISIMQELPPEKKQEVLKYAEEKKILSVVKNDKASAIRGKQDTEMLSSLVTMVKPERKGKKKIL